MSTRFQAWSGALRRGWIWILLTFVFASGIGIAATRLSLQPRSAGGYPHTVSELAFVWLRHDAKLSALYTLAALALFGWLSMVIFRGAFVRSLGPSRGFGPATLATLTCRGTALLLQIALVLAAKPLLLRLKTYAAETFISRASTLSLLLLCVTIAAGIFIACQLIATITEACWAAQGSLRAGLRLMPRVLSSAGRAVALAVTAAGLLYAVATAVPLLASGVLPPWALALALEATLLLKVAVGFALLAALHQIALRQAAD